MPFIYPTSAEMREIEPDLMTQGLSGRLGFDILPQRNVQTGKVRWSQKDNYYGLMQMRGLDGAPLHINRVGMKVYEYEPGYFGEFGTVTETELTTRAQSINITTVNVDVSDLILEIKQNLIDREVDRKEVSIWTLLTTGVLRIIQDGPNGTQITYADSYNFQSYTPTYPWSNLANSTPLADFQYIQQLGQAAGHSVDFDASAKAYANTITINRLLNNQNANDFGGRRSQYGATLNAMPVFNSYFASQGLPQLVPYDNVYATGPNTVQKFIPNGIIVVVGKRPSGAPAGWYHNTINASNNFKPGSYDYVLDRANGSASGSAPAEKRTPATIEVHRGFNGGPSIDYPSSIIVMHV